jgi:hypothetical protein
MFRAVLFVTAAIGLLAAAPALAEDTYTLKLYEAKKGDKSEHEKTEKTVTTITFKGAGMEKTDEIPTAKKEVFTEEILEKAAGDKKPTKLSRTYTVAEKTVKGGITKESYSGKTVLVEKKGEKYELSVGGKALNESDAPDLYKKFNKKDGPQNQDLLPTEPVKVGAGWKVAADKAEKVFKSFDDDKLKIDPKKSTIEGKLLKAYKKDGAQFGVFELTLTLVVTEIDLNGQGVKTSADSKIVMKGTIDTCIDGTVASEEGKMEMTANIVAEIPTVGTLTLGVKTTTEEKVRAKK